MKYDLGGNIVEMTRGLFFSTHKEIGRGYRVGYSSILYQLTCVHAIHAKAVLMRWLAKTERIKVWYSVAKERPTLLKILDLDLNLVIVRHVRHAVNI